MVFEQLASHHGEQLLDFELKNQQWFETLIAPRAQSFYSNRGIAEHIESLINQMSLIQRTVVFYCKIIRLLPEQTLKTLQIIKLMLAIV